MGFGRAGFSKPLAWHKRVLGELWGKEQQRRNFWVLREGGGGGHCFLSLINLRKFDKSKDSIAKTGFVSKINW